jgi:OCT family organic cation transporter-like MFS transporter 4/5
LSIFNVDLFWSGYGIGVIICCLIAKFISSATFLIVYVQTVELYPTCIRNTGMGFTSLLGMVIGISGPYVIHLGNVDIRYPYGIMGTITLCGAIAVIPKNFKVIFKEA